MARARRRDLLARGLAEGRHALAPVLEVAVDDLQRDGPANRLIEAHAREDVDLVLLDLHAAAAAVALLATCQVFIDGLEVQFEAGRQSLEDSRQAQAV